jgi:apolipoprotein N-acyltransferase
MANRQVDHRLRGEWGVKVVLAAAVASAFLLWASAPPVGAGPLAWIALVPVAAVVLSTPGTTASRVAVPLAYAVYLELLLVPALPFGLTEGEWGETPIPLLIGDSPVIVVALVAVPLFATALYAIRFPTLGTFRSPPRSAPALVAAVVVAATAWTALDFARAKADPGGLWGPLFLSQHDIAPGDLAGLAGPWLITFLIVVANFGIAAAILRARRMRVTDAVAAAFVGVLLLFAPSGSAADGDRTVVAAIQPGYDTTESGRAVLRYFNPGTYELAALDLIADLAPMTEEAARQGAVVVVWPEAAIWVDPVRTPVVRAALAKLARSAQVSLVVPYFISKPGQGATVAVGPDGRFSDTQPKQRPMWFWGEDGGNRKPPRPVAVAGTSVGTLLGVDNQDPRPARLLADRGAGLIASSTHDWSELASAQRALAQLHARESEIPVVRSDWRYGSMIIDADGHKVADAGTGLRRTALVAAVRLRAGSTPYMQIGDALGWVALGVACVLLLVRGAAYLRQIA